MRSDIWLYLAVMAGVTWLIRTLPLTLIRRPNHRRQFLPVPPKRK